MKKFNSYEEMLLHCELTGEDIAEGMHICKNGDCVEVTECEMELVYKL